MWRHVVREPRAPHLPSPPTPGSVRQIRGVPRLARASPSRPRASRASPPPLHRPASRAFDPIARATATLRGPAPLALPTTTAMAVSLATPAALATRRPVASATRVAIPARLPSARPPSARLPFARLPSARLPARLASARVVRRRSRSVLARAGADGEGSLLDELDADARCPVPKDQRPASQLRELQDSLLLGWGGLELVPYVTRLGALGAFFYVVISKPIADYSYDPATQPVESIICALTGSFVAVAVFALFIYNNWSYVRDRLLSATVEYEETGWYDGQTYVKDPEMLARDRLLGTYTVRPIVERLRKTLLACGVGVFASLAALSAIDAPEYGVEGSRVTYEGGGAGFYRADSAASFERDDDVDDAEEEAEEMRRYEAAMERFRRDNEANAAAAAAAAAAEGGGSE